MRKVIHGLLGDAIDGVALSDLAESIGYEIAQARDPSDAVVLRETGARNGGVYLLRLRSSSRLLIEVSDASTDDETLAAACQLFRRTDARTLSIGTTRTHRPLPESMFDAVTRALAQAVPNATVVDVRGAPHDGRHRLLGAPNIE